MKGSVKLNNSIEFMDLTLKHKQFQLCKLKIAIPYEPTYLFDRALYLQVGGTLETGLDLLIFGGFRGDLQFPQLSP